MQVLVVADFSDFYNRSALAGAAAYARQRGWELMQEQPRGISELHDAVAGADALLMGSHPFESDLRLSRAVQPTVSWSASRAEVNWPRVLSNDLAVGRAAAEHLLSLGLRRFAFFTDLTGIWVDRRREGLLAYLESRGHSDVSVFATEPTVGEDEIAAWLRERAYPLGLMVVHDAAAIKVLAACHRIGLRVPEDVALIGVNNDDRVIDVVSPPLTTVPLQTHQIGYEAASLLHQIIAKPARTPWSILVPPGEVIVRESSDVMCQREGVVGEAVRFIRERLSDGVEAKQVVAHIGVSRTTLNMKFQAELGRSVAAEVRRTRIERCRQILCTTDVAMPEVARRVGFSSARRLSEVFHREVGVTPTQFRSQFKTITLPA